MRDQSRPRPHPRRGVAVAVLPLLLALAGVAGQPAEVRAQGSVVTVPSATPGFYVWYRDQEFTCCKGADGVTPHPVHYDALPADRSGVVVLSGPYTQLETLATWLCSHTVNPAQAWIRNWAIVNGVLLSNLPCKATGVPDNLRTPVTVTTRPPVAGTTRTVDLALLAKSIERYVPGANGFMQPLMTPETVKPPGFAVEMIVRWRDRRNCEKGGSFRFSIKTKVLAATEIEPQVGACHFHVLVPTEGTHTIAVSTRAADGTIGHGTVRVVVLDWLVVGLGDSNGAGEGDPDNGTWVDERCHRSSGSYQAQVARAIEQSDPATSVTFLHLACSGAQLESGLLKPYEGLVPPAGAAPLAAQVDEMVRLTARREIDAVIISIGINDLGFAKLVVFCLKNADCPNAVNYDENEPQKTLAAVTDDVVKKQLPARFQELSRRLKLANVRPSRVFISQYFDPTRHDNGVACDPLIGNIFGTTGAFDGNETQWAQNAVLGPLNQTLRDAAQKYGWRVTRGVPEGFSTHGYCALIDPWIVTISESFFNQWDKAGSLHANRKGNTFTASVVTPLVRASLYPGGKPRQPE